MNFTNRLKKILLTILKLLYYVVIFFVCIIAAFLVYYIISVQVHSKDKDYKPGISIYTIVSPSMTPNINVYDVVVNVKVSNPTDIAVGDIITFKSQSATSEGMTITHRVIAIEELPNGQYEYLTQGDNNSEPDSSYVSFNNVIGKEILIIPKLGKLQFLIANEKSWLFLLLIPVSIYLLREIYKLIDLLGLKNKVKEITKEEPEEDLIDHEKQEQLKERIKEDLFGKTIKPAILTHKEEPEEFLEKYNENTIKVEENKYSKYDDYKEVKEEKMVLDNKPVIKKAEVSFDIDLPKPKEYEALDTSDTEKAYLQGTKIKVTNIEETKNKKKKKLTNVTPKDTKGKLDLDEDKYIPNKNPNLKVERPLGEDIKEKRRLETNSKPEQPTNKEKKNLKLNPRNIKKVNRGRKNNRNKQLNLNPRNVKKINRRPNQNNKSKKKKGIIGIEKIK